MKRLDQIMKEITLMDEFFTKNYDSFKEESVPSYQLYVNPGTNLVVEWDLVEEPFDKIQKVVSVNEEALLETDDLNKIRRFIAKLDLEE